MYRPHCHGIGLVASFRLFISPSRSWRACCWDGGSPWPHTHHVAIASVFQWEYTVRRRRPLLQRVDFVLSASKTGERKKTKKLKFQQKVKGISFKEREWEVNSWQGLHVTNAQMHQHGPQWVHSTLFHALFVCRFFTSPSECKKKLFFVYFAHRFILIGLTRWKIWKKNTK